MYLIIYINRGEKRNYLFYFLFCFVLIFLIQVVKYSYSMVIIKQLFKKKEWLNVIQRLSENDNLSLNKRYQVSKYKNWRANFEDFLFVT